MLKSAGMISPEVGLLKEIAGMKQTQAQCWMRRKNSRSGGRIESNEGAPEEIRKEKVGKVPA